LEIKSLLFGTGLSIAVGGGLYGLYLKTLAPAVLTEAHALELVQKCLEYNNAATIPFHVAEIEILLKTIHEHRKDIGKADAVAAVVAGGPSTSGDLRGVGPSLSRCAKQLERKVGKFRGER
jgi:hypothetical protein